MDRYSEDTLLFTADDSVEETLPSLPYATLVRRLGSFTALGVFQEEGIEMMLVVARLIDRNRILRSGMTAAELERALADYRRAEDWTPLDVIEKALERAVAVARQSEADAAKLKDKADTTTYAAW
jgi:hypothetical protein